MFRQVVGNGMPLVIGGLLLGTVAALALTRLLTSMLFDVSARDLMMLVTANAVLAVAGLLACAGHRFPAGVYKLGLISRGFAFTCRISFRRRAVALASGFL